MQTRLLFALDDLEIELALDRDGAPRTAAALLANLPLRADLHCAKIAGNHIFWHAPFVEPLEGETSVLDLPAGNFLYWPDRQFLELIYAPLQAESAQVTPLGRMLGPIGPLQDLGRRVIEYHGIRPLFAELSILSGAVPEAPESRLPGDLAGLSDLRRLAWRAEPKEIAELVGRRGVMLPLGPLLLAESEFRKLQEHLWELLMGEAGEPNFAARAGGGLLDHAARRVGGLCGLAEAAGHLGRFRDALRRTPSAAAAILEEAVLYSGRMAAWLDLRIPWDRLQQASLAALSECEENKR